jgi:pyruvate,orthophosphate dikinase
VAGDDGVRVHHLDEVWSGDPEERVVRLGSKAAGLATMLELGLPVPPAFTLVAADEASENELRAALAEGIAGLEGRTGLRFGAGDAPLLVSVRSGAPTSMPGVLATVLDVGLTTATAGAFADVRAGVRAGLRRSWTSAGAPEPIPDDADEQLLLAVRAVLASVHSARAHAYREAEGVAVVRTPVTVQQMVFGDRDERSGSGVAFSRDPSTGAPGLVGDWAWQVQGDEVVDGRAAAVPLAELAGRLPQVWTEVQEVVARLERHHDDLVDVELTVESGRLHLLQCRPGLRSPDAGARIAVELAEDPERRLDRAGAVERTRHLLDAPTPAPAGPVVAPEGDVLVAGLPAAPGVVAGEVCFELAQLQACQERGVAAVLLCARTGPEDLPLLLAADALVATAGGRLSHAALVVRHRGCPAVVGALALEVHQGDALAGPVRLLAGDRVTVDGTAGVLLTGWHVAVPRPSPHLEQLRAWREQASTAASVAGPSDDGHDAAVEGEQLVRLLGVKGLASADDLAVALGVAPGALVAVLQRQEEAGLVARRGVGDLLALTPVGEIVFDGALADDRRGRADALVDLLDAFAPLDRALKTWMAAAPPAAAGPPDARLVVELRTEVHEPVLALLDGPDAADPLAFARYPARLDHALAAVAAGDGRYVAHPAVASYHSTWFELHEHLLRLVGRRRDLQA